MDSSVSMRDGLSGSFTSSVVRWMLSSSLGGARESSVVVS